MVCAKWYGTRRCGVRAPSQASTASFALAFSFAFTDSNFPLTLMMLACGHFCTQMPQLVHFA